MVDDNLPKSLSRSIGGRKSILRNSEVVTILVFSLFQSQQQTLKQIYSFISYYHHQDFPYLPNYQNFVKHCHRVLPLMKDLLDNLLCNDAKLRFMDSTMLEVCRIVRKRFHKVAKAKAKVGYNWQGEHYGFKLHLSIDNDGKMCAYTFSDASIHDSRAIPLLVNEHTRLAVGDTGYRSRPMHRNIRAAFGTFILTPPHYKQDKQLAKLSQIKLLRRRVKIETVFDYLKQHLHLQSSFPRSLAGYALHYIRVLLGYQLLCLGW
jgi:hypothetical protein